MKAEKTAGTGVSLDDTAEEKATKVLTENLITGEGDTKVLVIRHDNATVIYERQKMKLTGILDTATRYLDKRVALINQLSSNVIVNREAMTISLTVDEEGHFKIPINGKLEFHPDFKKWGVNEGNYLSPGVLGDFIKMNRADFENIDTAMKLVKELKSFVANVTKDIERVENNRGDRKMLQQQYVTSNIPESFNLIVPIFKGYGKVKFEVEVYINPENLQATLVSPEVNERLASTRDSAIDKELDKIRELAPDLLIIEE